jgi:hypothetical protein
MTRKVPAWQVQTGSSTTPEWVYIFAPEIDGMGWPRVRTVHYLTPVDPEEQERLGKIKPDWLKEEK